MKTYFVKVNPNQDVGALYYSYNSIEELVIDNNAYQPLEIFEAELKSIGFYKLQNLAISCEAPSKETK